MKDQYVYTFNEGNAGMKELLGGKGANLAEMAGLGLPVPPGVTITTEAWTQWDNLSSEPLEQLNFVRRLVETALGAMISEYDFSDEMPLLAVRSGARVSMPGMMDTILNVGIESKFNYWEAKLGKRVALDCLRRYQHMFGETALGVPGHLFGEALAKIKSFKYDLNAAPENDAEMGVTHLRKLTERYHEIISANHGYWKYELPTALEACITAVFNSWNSERAIAYRKLHNIPGDWGTAVTIQAMVFGNMNDESCSGVLFSRDPSTGANGLVGEFLPKAQGEDVVAGIRTPISLLEMEGWSDEIFDGLCAIASRMELHYRDMQDMEFTVEDGKLYILQTRNGKRSAKAAFVIAHDLHKEGLISQKEAVARVTGKQYAQLNTPTIDPTFDVAPDLTGIGASAGVVRGVAVFSKEEAEACPTDCILVREETTPDDFSGMVAAKGILTSTGGSTSHAAVVARGMDTACVVGATDLEIQGCMAGVGGVFQIDEGDIITIDGSTGNVWFNVEVPVQAADIGAEVNALLNWAGLEDQEVITITSLNAVKQCKQGANVLLDAQAIGEDFAEVMKLADERGLTGVIDLEGETHPEDDLLTTTFNLSGGTEASMKFLATPEKGNPNWVVNVKHELFRKVLKKLDWKLVNVVDNLGEFLKAKGITEFSSSFLNLLSEQGVSNIDELVAMNKNVSRLQRALPKERLVFEVLGTREA